MRSFGIALILSFLVAVTYGAELRDFEVRIRTPGDRDDSDVVQAPDAAAAADIAAARYPGARILSPRDVAPQAGREWYLAKLTVDGVNLEDTVLATGSGEARRILTRRFPAGRIVSLNALRDASRLRLYESTVYGAGEKAFKDVVSASSPGAAQKALQARYPGARIGSLRGLGDVPRTVAVDDAARKAEDAEARRQAAAAANARLEKARHDEYRAVVEAGQEALAKKKAARQELQAAEKAAKAAGRAGAISPAEVVKRLKQAGREAQAARQRADREAAAKKAVARNATKAAAK